MAVAAVVKRREKAMGEFKRPQKARRAPEGLSRRQRKNRQSSRHERSQRRSGNRTDAARRNRAPGGCRGAKPRRYRRQQAKQRGWNSQAGCQFSRIQKEALGEEGKVVTVIEVSAAIQCQQPVIE
jgi:hypothetical protein